MRCALVLLVLRGCQCVQLRFRARRAKTLPTPPSGATARIFREDEQHRRVLNLDFVPRVGWRGTVFPAIVSPSLAAVATAGATIYAHETIGFAGIDATGHLMLGVLVSFMTVFRSQQGYARYWEARGHLGALMSSLVDAASLGAVHLEADDARAAADARAELARLLRVYFTEVVVFLRHESVETEKVGTFWKPADAPARAELVRSHDRETTDDERAALGRAARPPVLVLTWIRAHLQDCVRRGVFVGGSRGERQRALASGVERVLQTLPAHFNGAAKIATTPTPQPYLQMSRWLIFAFVLSVPLPLLSKALATPLAILPVTVFLAFGYYGLDYCSNQLANPFVADFGDAALDGHFLRAVCTDVDMLLLEARGDGH